MKTVTYTHIYTDGTTYTTKMDTADTPNMGTADTREMGTADTPYTSTVDTIQIGTADRMQTHTADTIQRRTAGTTQMGTGRQTEKNTRPSLAAALMTCELQDAISADHHDGNECSSNTQYIYSTYSIYSGVNLLIFPC